MLGIAPGGAKIRLGLYTQLPRERDHPTMYESSGVYMMDQSIRRELRSGDSEVGSCGPITTHAEARRET